MYKALLEEHKNTPFIYISKYVGKIEKFNDMQSTQKATIILISTKCGP